MIALIIGKRIGSSRPRRDGARGPRLTSPCRPGRSPNGAASLRRILYTGVAGSERSHVATARLGEEVLRRTTAGLSRQRPNEARAARDRAAQARSCQAEGRARHPKKLSRADARLRSVETAGAILAALEGSGRQLIGGTVPVKKRGPWVHWGLRVVTPFRRRLGITQTLLPKLDEGLLPEAITGDRPELKPVNTRCHRHRIQDACGYREPDLF